jgi:hypothetical protein
MKKLLLSCIGWLKGLPGLSCCPLSKTHLTCAQQWLPVQAVAQELSNIEHA